MIYVKQTITVRWLAIVCIPPMVIIAVGISSRTAALFEPFVLIAAVIEYKIHYELYATFMHRFYQRIKICHCSKVFHNVAVIAYIVAVIIVRGTIDRV